MRIEPFGKSLPTVACLPEAPRIEPSVQKESATVHMFSPCAVHHQSIKSPRGAEFHVRFSAPTTCFNRVRTKRELARPPVLCAVGWAPMKRSDASSAPLGIRVAAPFDTACRGVAPLDTVSSPLSNLLNSSR
jgi:hypothetical protein